MRIPGAFRTGMEMTGNPSCSVFLSLALSLPFSFSLFLSLSLSLRIYCSHFQYLCLPLLPTSLWRSDPPPFPPTSLAIYFLEG